MIGFRILGIFVLLLAGALVWLCAATRLILPATLAVLAFAVSLLVTGLILLLSKDRHSLKENLAAIATVPWF
ncbi:MAG: hypothetical protein JWN38_314 [Candidatus Saccharibacteria bacterium]|nr:hypothetical protein [Candidatus Saccharibacteria bacterium]